MLDDLNIVSYKQLEDKNKFLNALILEGNKADFSLLQSCLNVYKPPEKNLQSAQDAILSGFLTSFKFNIPKAMDYLDIDRSGAVSKGEFIHGVKGIVKGYEHVE